MPGPFPGMDPWLEAANVGPGCHDTLVIKAVEALQPQLRSRGYYATPGERLWLSNAGRAVYPDTVVVTRPPHGNANVPAISGPAALAELDDPITIERSTVEVHEGFVEIYEMGEERLITGIEFLSPANKVDHDGRRLYEKKRRELDEAGVHLVEIDLIRRGPHVLDVPEGFLTPFRPYDYLINISRRGSTKYEVYPLSLSDKLPRVRIPLKPGDADVGLPLQEILGATYDLLAYADRLNYSALPPEPALTEAQSAWIDETLRSKGLR